MNNPIIVKDQLGNFHQAVPCHRDDMWRVTPVKEEDGKWVPRYANPQWNSAGYIRKDRCEVAEFGEQANDG